MSNGSDHQRAFSARYGARAPLLAPWPRSGIYLLWRAFITCIRPALFLGLLIAAGFFLFSAFQRLPEFRAFQPGLSHRVEATFADASPDVADRRAIWVNGAVSALDAAPGASPDLPLAESYVHSAIAIEGEEALALAIASQNRTRQGLEAELRARPVTQADHILAAALDERLDQGRRAGLEPPVLILAPAGLRARLSRARRLYGPALSDAGDWFVDPQGRALSLRALPGFDHSDPILYGDVRDVLVSGCALAQEARRRVGQCRVGFLPKPGADPVFAGLSLAVLGASAEERSGARLIKAAWAAGRLDRGLAQALALGPDAELGREALLASIMPTLTQTGDAWTQPVRFQASLEDAAGQSARAAHLDLVERSAVFSSIGHVREHAGALAALRLIDGLRGPGDAYHLAAVSEQAGEKLLALHALDPQAVTGLLRAEMNASRLAVSKWPKRARLEAGAAAGLVLLALIVLFASLIAGFLRARGARPGWLERVDGAVTRLTLGKND